MGKTTILTVILVTISGVILALGVAGCAGVPDPAVAQAEAQRQAVAIEATRQAMAFQAEREALNLEREAFNLERERARAESVDVFLAGLPWVILLVGLGAAAVVGYLFLPVLVAKAGLVRRQPEEGEPVWLLGRNRLALPLRSAGVYQDLTKGAERAPLLAESAEAQERATLRQQTANALLASQASEIVKGRTGGGDVYLLPDRHERVQATRADRTGEPGLLPQISNEAVPPKLLEAITTQWEEVDEVEV